MAAKRRRAPTRRASKARKTRTPRARTKSRGAVRKVRSSRKPAVRSIRNVRFVKPPPKRAMRTRKPTSAPRLFEWLVDRGYVEPISTASRARKTTRRNRNARKR